LVRNISIQSEEAFCWTCCKETECQTAVQAEGRKMRLERVGTYVGDGDRKILDLVDVPVAVGKAVPGKVRKGLARWGRVVKVDVAGWGG
jgi:hypothetical protein